MFGRFIVMCSIAEVTTPMWLCAGRASSPEQEDHLEYSAPFILPWIVLNQDMAPDQPESFIPFSTGPNGAQAHHKSQPSPPEPFSVLVKCTVHV
jgi:hypothetical protein